MEGEIAGLSTPDLAAEITTLAGHLNAANARFLALLGEFDRRRHLIVKGLNAIPGFACVMPKGAFYAFLNVSGLFGREWRSPEGPKTLKGSLDVTAFLLEEAKVAVVPGVDFGSDDHVRLSYATSAALITEGLARMGAAVATLA